MAKKQIPDTSEKIYELRKDATTPAGYWRAGARKTESEWHKEFGNFHMSISSDWFIDLSELKEEYKPDRLYELVKDVFHKKGLYSISYKEAACEVAALWLKQNQSK